MSDDFQRARRPEQVEARRVAILDAAATMLAERPVADISLRELSDRVGLAKSNVLRYFDSREAIFLEVLDQQWGAFLDELAPVLAEIGVPPVVGGSGVPPALFAREIAVATAVASELVARPLLCELFSAMAGVLERNISVDFARVFKRRAAAHSTRLAMLVASAVPGLSDVDAAHFAGAACVATAGLWPYAVPTEAVATVAAEMGVPPAWDRFVAGLTDGLVNQLVGLNARAGLASAGLPQAGLPSAGSSQAGLPSAGPSSGGAASSPGCG